MLLFLVACTGAPPPTEGCTPSTWYADADADGFGDPAAPTEACDAPDGRAQDATDCDDGDPNTHPDAPERCDGADQDCDGAVDEDARDARTWYADADADGYGDVETTTATCDTPAGFTADASDCDDLDPAVHPGALEVCDDVDDDCDGVADQSDAPTWYADADADGYGDPTVSIDACARPDGHVGDATDCDDTNAEVSPGAAEVCGNGLDDDCTGDAPECDVPSGEADLSTVADAVFEGASAGTGVAFFGDYDGDGSDDVLVGDFGDAGSGAGVYVVSGPTSGTYVLGTDAVALLTSGTNGVEWHVSGAGDFDADGLADVLTGEYAGTEAYIMTGGRVGERSFDEAALVLAGEEINDVAALGDIDGDGADDVVFGDQRVGDDAGAAYLVLGGRTGTLALADADAVYAAEDADDLVGRDVSPGGDLDGDGAEDLLVGACGESTGADRAGATYVVLQPAVGSSSVADAHAKLTGGTEGAWVCRGGRAGDLDGDGRDDLAIAGQFADGLATYSGVVYLWFSTPSGVVSVTAADATWAGRGDRDYVEELAGGDVNGDGASDLLVGAPGVDDGGADAGAAYLIYGPFGTGSFDMGGAAARLLGSSDGDEAGSAVALGDQDGDGFADLLVGGPWATRSPGYAWLIRGGSGM